MFHIIGLFIDCFFLFLRDGMATFSSTGRKIVAIGQFPLNILEVTFVT